MDDKNKEDDLSLKDMDLKDYFKAIFKEDNESDDNESDDPYHWTNFFGKGDDNEN